VRAAQSDFHPRYDATARLYRYSIYSQPVRDPFVERYAWRVWPAPQLELLQAGAKLLIGTHDFAAFGHPPRKGGSTVRSVMKAAWEASPQPGEGMTGWVFEIAANGFLNRMVRRLVYLLVCIGQGWHEPGAVSQYLNSPNQALVAGQAPPQGLTLVEVLYV
jgi:tRNA pseudouridine38-40 synthase